MNTEGTDRCMAKVCRSTSMEKGWNTEHWWRSAVQEKEKESEKNTWKTLSSICLNRESIIYLANTLKSFVSSVFVDVVLFFHPCRRIYIWCRVCVYVFGLFVDSFLQLKSNSTFEHSQTHTLLMRAISHSRSRLIHTQSLAR